MTGIYDIAKAGDRIDVSILQEGDSNGPDIMNIIVAGSLHGIYGYVEDLVRKYFMGTVLHKGDSFTITNIQVNGVDLEE